MNDNELREEIAKIMAGDFLPVYLVNGEIKKLLEFAENLANAGYRKLDDHAIKVLRKAKGIEERIRKETVREVLNDIKYNLENSQPLSVKNGEKCASDDYDNVMTWIEQIAGDYGVDLDL